MKGNLMIDWIISTTVNGEACEIVATPSNTRFDLCLLKWTSGSGDHQVKHKRWVLSRDLYKPIEIRSVRKALASYED